MFHLQGLNFIHYIVFNEKILKWFRKLPKKQVQLGKDASLVQKFFALLKAPDTQSAYIGHWQRRGLLCCLILVFGLIVFSHPLTPFFTLLSVSALVVFRRCYPFWLPILMVAMMAFWDIVVACPYFASPHNLLPPLRDTLFYFPTTLS